MWPGTCQWCSGGLQTIMTWSCSCNVGGTKRSQLKLTDISEPRSPAATGVAGRWHPDRKAFWKRVVQILVLSAVFHFPSFMLQPGHKRKSSFTKLITVVAAQRPHLACRRSPSAAAERYPQTPWQTDKYRETSFISSFTDTVFHPATSMPDSPVTQMRLDGKQVFVEALDGFFLKYVVDPSSSVQHTHFNLSRLRLFCWTRGLCLLTHCCKDRGGKGRQQK